MEKSSHPIKNTPPDGRGPPPRRTGPDHGNPRGVGGPLPTAGARLGPSTERSIPHFITREPPSVPHGFPAREFMAYGDTNNASHGNPVPPVPGNPRVNDFDARIRSSMAWHAAQRLQGLRLGIPPGHRHQQPHQGTYRGPFIVTPTPQFGHYGPNGATRNTFQGGPYARQYVPLYPPHLPGGQHPSYLRPVGVPYDPYCSYPSPAPQQQHAHLHQSRPSNLRSTMAQGIPAQPTHGHPNPYAAWNTSTVVNPVYGQKKEATPVKDAQQKCQGKARPGNSTDPHGRLTERNPKSRTVAMPSQIAPPPKHGSYLPFSHAPNDPRLDHRYNSDVPVSPSESDQHMQSRVLNHQEAREISQEHSPPPPKNFDDFEQPIVYDYDDYERSAKLYTVDREKTGCEFAYYWLEDQFATLDFEQTYKWFAHTTEGFIKDGNHLSFLVLHNATNPFEFDESSGTTTFGFYFDSPDQLGWKTISPGVLSIIETALADGSIAEVKKWHKEMKASESRFHRAYWLAANRLPLSTLLNRAPTDDNEIELPIPNWQKRREPKRIEEAEDGTAEAEGMEHDQEPEFNESDVGNDGVEITPSEAAMIWERCLADAGAESPVYRPDYAVTGCSEWL